MSPTSTKELDFKSPEEILRQQLSYRGVNLVDFQTFQGMVPQNGSTTPPKRQKNDSQSPIGSSPRFNPNPTNISLIANKPPSFDPRGMYYWNSQIQKINKCI